jgi:uncharacterized repeat protein (TIGR01451 family)
VGTTGSANFPLAGSLKPGPIINDSDAFVTRFSASGASLDFSTCLGGAAADQGIAIAVDTTGSAYVTGLTFSSDFPTVSAPQPNLSLSTDAFVTKLSPAGAAIVYSTYLGGNGTDQGNGIAVDPQGNAYVIGNTASPDFPTANAFQSTLKGFDAFVTKIGPNADLSIAQTESRDPVMVGNNLTYTLSVSNLGPDDAAGVIVSDTLPAGVAFVSATASQGPCAGTSTVTCNLGNMSKSANATVTLVIRPPSTGTITNTATVTSNTPDASIANNSATEQTQVSALPAIAGRVTSAGGLGLANVGMALSGSQTSSTTTSGAWSTVVPKFVVAEYAAAHPV